MNRQLGPQLGMTLSGSAPVQVLMVTDSRDPSGVGHHMITLARHLGPGFQPVLGFAAGPTANDFIALARASGVEAWVVKDEDWSAWITARGANLLHVHAGIGWEGQALVAIGRDAGLPILRTEHLPWLITDPIQRQDYAVGLRGVDQVLTVSHSSAQSLTLGLAHLGATPPIRAIANGVSTPLPRVGRAEVRRALGLGPGARLILHVGRFTAQKAQDTLVAAYADLCRDIPDLWLMMIGTGETRSRIENQVSALGLERVLIHDIRVDMADVMHAADLFALPSRFEGLPLVLLEAMALGLPVVATRVAGIVDTLGRSYAGLVPPGDVPALAAAMAARLTDANAIRAESAGLATRYCNSFTAERMAAEIARVYRQTLRRRIAVLEPPLRQTTPRPIRQRTAATMQTLTRIGFIGAGGIAQRHLRVLADFSDVHIVAIVDPDQHRADAAAAPIRARVYADVDGMIAAEELDALFICVPPFAHGPAERSAIAAGLPFFVEKPVSLDLELAEAISNEVRAAGLVTAVGYHWRYLDTVDAARRAVADRPAQLIVGHWLDGTPPPDWWGQMAGSGGQFVEQVTHVIDAARLLAGGVCAVYAQGNHLARGQFPSLDVPTSGAATLTFENGAVATLSATCLLNWNHRTGLHVFADGLAIELSDMEVMLDTGHGRHPRPAEGDPVWREDRDFIDAVQGKPDHIRTTYSDALETHRIALAVAQSMQSGAVISLTPAPPAPQPRPGLLRQRPARRDEHRRIRSLGIEAPGRAYLFDYDEGPATGGQVRLDLCYSGFSAGTELTFLKGTNPYLQSRWDDETGVFREGEPGLHFPIPFMGYMECARVIDSHAEGFANGQILGATFGHKTGHTAIAATEHLVPLPPHMDALLGIFVAQMGPIAANGILHAAAVFGGPGAEFGAGVAGKHVVVWGGGTVGLLTALFAREAGAAALVVAEPSPFRRAIAERLGLSAMSEGEAWQHAKSWNDGASGRGADVVFQTRAHAESLHLGLRALRPQGVLIDLAFYQGGMTGVRLGEEFHHNGLMIACAQIGRVPAGMAEAWTRQRLSEQTLELLVHCGEAIRDAMITHVVPFAEAPDFLGHLIDKRPEFLQIVFAHSP